MLNKTAWSCPDLEAMDVTRAESGFMLLSTLILRAKERESFKRTLSALTASQKVPVSQEVDRTTNSG